jgi:hypothetical protein
MCLSSDIISAKELFIVGFTKKFLKKIVFKLSDRVRGKLQGDLNMRGTITALSGSGRERKKLCSDRIGNLGNLFWEVDKDRWILMEPEMIAQTEDSDLNEEFGNDDEIDLEDSASAVNVDK